jgi:hypothetical protein
VTELGEQLALEANEQLDKGDEAGALGVLERAREVAKKASDVEGLAAVTAAGEMLADRFTGRHAKAFKRLLYAAQQNQAFAIRATERSSADRTQPVPHVQRAPTKSKPANTETSSHAPPEALGSAIASNAAEGSDDPVALRPDVEAAKARMRSKLGSGRELKKLDEYLWHDETVSRMVKGALNGKMGLLVFTDRRLIFLFHGWISQRNEDFPLDTIGSISVKAGMSMATITVYSSGAKHEISAVFKDDAKVITDEIRNRIATRGQVNAPPSPAPAAPSEMASAAPQVDVLAQLKQLGELRDAGVLTDEEFEGKKAELLGRL